jgi:hypothetical protein
MITAKVRIERTLSLKLSSIQWCCAGLYAREFPRAPRPASGQYSEKATLRSFRLAPLRCVRSTRSIPLLLTFSPYGGK